MFKERFDYVCLQCGFSSSINPYYAREDVLENAAYSTGQGVLVLKDVGTSLTQFE